MTTTVDFWSSSEGMQLLELVRVLLQQYNGDTLRTVSALRAATPQYGAFHSQALSLTQARGKAREYGMWTERGLFTRQSVEQATAPALAQHHAERFRGCATVVEICTGAGFDTAALARVAQRVVSIEANPELAAMARHNLACQGITNVDVRVGTAEEVVPTLDLSRVDGVWADPSRRTDTRRLDNPDDYAPSLSFVLGVAGERRCGIKIAPAATLSAVPQGWVREWVGYGGECREQVLWNAADVVDNTVSLVDSGIAFQPSTAVARESLVCTVPMLHWTGMMLVEPHNALVRSGVLQEFYAERGIELLDTHIAYGLCRQDAEPSPFFTRFRIVEAFAWNEKHVRKRLKERGWSNATEIKKRGFPHTPEQVRAKLKLPAQGKQGVVVLTRMGNKHVVVLAERVYEGESP